MDFVVSKVAMSICALLVVATLGGMFKGDMFVDRRGELETILDRLCSLTDRLERSGLETRLSWQVPALSTGKGIEIAVHGNTFSAESENYKVMRQAENPVHLWAWDGKGLNRSEVECLDGLAQELRLVSGQLFELRVSPVMIENEREQMVFGALGA